MNLAVSETSSGFGVATAHCYVLVSFVLHTGPWLRSAVAVELNGVRFSLNCVASFACLLIPVGSLALDSIEVSTDNGRFYHRQLEPGSFKTLDHFDFCEKC